MLRPSGCTGGGFRLYTDDAVERRARLVRHVRMADEFVGLLAQWS